MKASWSDNWQEKSTFRKTATLGHASQYCEHRFDGSRRMRRLNRCEFDFARSLMDLVGPDASVLDVPCGTGRFFEVFCGARRYAMLDYNEAMLTVIRDRFRGRRELELVQGDIVNMSFEDGAFDLAFCMRLLHHIGDESICRQIMAELARVSRRYVGVSVYDKHTFRYFKRVALGRRPSGNSVVLGQFVAMAGQLGLRLVRKMPRFSWIEQQRMLLFEKLDSTGTRRSQGQISK